MEQPGHSHTNLLVGREYKLSAFCQVSSSKVGANFLLPANSFQIFYVHNLYQDGWIYLISRSGFLAKHKFDALEGTFKFVPIHKHACPWIKQHTLLSEVIRHGELHNIKCIISKRKYEMQIKYHGDRFACIQLHVPTLPQAMLVIAGAFITVTANRIISISKIITQRSINC